MPEEFLTSREVASELGVTPQTVRRLVREGRLPAILLDSSDTRKLIRFRRSEVTRWLEERLVGRR